MIGKHLYKKTSYIILLFWLSMLLMHSSSVWSASTDRHTLLVEFLHLTDKQPQWQSIKRLQLLEKALLTVKDDGLDPSKYQLSRIQRLLEVAHQDNTEIINLSAAEDAVISGAYLEVLADLMLGRTRNQSVERYLDSRRDKKSSLGSLVQLGIANLDNPENGLQLARPQVEDYDYLRTAHQRLHNHVERFSPLPAITPDRPSLRPGMTDARVVLLRQHLDVSTSEQNPSYFDEALKQAVSDYQRQHGLEADGIAGPQTLARLNRTPQQDLDDVRVNLERWRRVNPALTDSRVVANTAGATLRYYQDNQLILDTRTQVGRRDRQTPLMLSEISHFTLNPTWTVPPTIYRNDKLPAIQQDQSYLDSNRLTVLDTQGNRLDPESIDWDNPGSILLRQAAGPYNALGQVVIRFPNQQSIYLHDTPNQRLFDRTQRYFSSGCVRVEDASRLVSLLLDATQSTHSAQYESLLSSGVTRNINIGAPVTIILGYWTVEANVHGELQVHTDIYDLDTTLLNALNL